MDFHGTDGSDLHLGDDTNQTINGAGGIDLLRGAGGNDTIDGGSGPDALYGDQGNDSIQGGAGNDVIRGGKGNDTLHGGANDDVIRADLGDDLIYGSNGADLMDGGAGNDTLSYADSPEGITLAGILVHYNFEEVLIAVVDTAQGGTAEGDIVLWDTIETIIGTEHADTIYSMDREYDVQEGNNTIHGRGGNDVLAGMNADTLQGGEGDDELTASRFVNGLVMTGGPGEDTFVLAATVRQATITDFSPGEKIRLLQGRFPDTDADSIQAMLDGSEGSTLDLSLLDSQHGTLTLEGVNVADLTVDDFIIG